MYCNRFDQRVARNSSVNTVYQATIEEALFSVDLNGAPIVSLDSNYVICVYCRFMSVPRLYISKSDRICSRQLQVVVAAEAREQASSKLKEYRGVQESLWTFNM
jgi:hypothetical protein